MDVRLFDIFVCLICKGNFEYCKVEKELVCKLCKLVFFICDDIFIMLEDEVR